MGLFKDGKDAVDAYKQQLDGKASPSSSMPKDARKSQALNLWGVTFVIFGILWALAGFALYQSDIQLALAVGGINMFGIGILMIGLNKR